MKEAVEAFSQIMTEEISYLGESNIYIKKDSWDLMQEDKTPFMNIRNTTTSRQRVPNISLNDAERRIIKIVVEYAVSSMSIETLYEGNTNEAGIDDFTESIIDAISTDPTLKGKVKGFVSDISDDPYVEWAAEPGVLKISAGYKAGYTMEISYYLDVFQ